jgi:hypothetical protein
VTNPDHIILGALAGLMALRSFFEHVKEVCDVNNAQGLESLPGFR